MYMKKKNETDIQNEKRGKDKQWKGWNRVQLIWMALRVESLTLFPLVPLWLCLSLLMYRSGTGDWVKRVWSHLKFSPTYCRSQKTRVRHDSFNSVVLSHSLIVLFFFSLPLPLLCLFQPHLSFHCYFWYPVIWDLTLWDRTSGHPVLAWKCPLQSPVAVFLFNPQALLHFLTLSSHGLCVVLQTSSSGHNERK